VTHPDDEHRLLLLYDDPLYPELLVPVTAELATGPDSPEVREVLARMRSRNYERVIWTSSGTTQPFLAGDEIV
jgi:hypothetical protein